MSKHTPGPWKTRNGFQDGSIEIFRPNKAIKKPFYPTEIAVVEAEEKEGKANARLIAAAPELLEALMAVLRWIDDNCETTGFEAVEAQADAALAKAGAELFNTN